MPAGVVALVVTDRVEAEVAGLGLKLPLAPLGNPLTLSVTWPLKPLVGVTARHNCAVSLDHRLTRRRCA